MHPRGLTPASTKGRQGQARRNDHAVLAAAREVFAARGADASISAVADRAGVGVATLYRRYGGRDDLLRHVCAEALEQIDGFGREALAAADPWAGLCGFVRACAVHRVGALAALAGQVAPSPEMVGRAGAVLDVVDHLLHRAQQAGVARPDATAADVVWLCELFGQRRPSTDPQADRLLALALDGLGIGAAAPLPGDAPDLDAYRARWTDRS